MKVTLKKNHTHAGVAYKAGQTVDVPVHDALWLKAEDLIEEGLDAVKAEVKKLVSKENPTPHSELLARAEAADAQRKADGAAVPPASGSAPSASDAPAASKS